MSVLLGGLAWLAFSFTLSLAIGKVFRALSSENEEKGGDEDAHRGRNQNIYRG